LLHPAGLSLLIRDYEAQRSFRRGEWLSVAMIGEQHHPLCKRWIEFW
jgi:hypothetical protein